MYFYIQQTLQILAWASLGVAGVTNLQVDFSLISESRIANGVVSPASESTFARALVPIERIRRIDLNKHLY